MDQVDLNKCSFVPSSAMEKAIEVLQNHVKISQDGSKLCKRNLYKLQRHKLNTKLKKAGVLNSGLDIFQFGVHKAIYSHDWDKLLYLLKKSPIITQYSSAMIRNQDKKNVYYRDVIILLMNHPTAKAKGLLHELMHMAYGCRTDNEKNALMRAILTLPEKIRLKVHVIHRKKYQFYYED